MSKSQLNIRIGNDLATALDQRADSTGKTKTAIVCDALSAYLDLPDDTRDIDTINKRLEQLERKFNSLSEIKPKKKKIQDEAPVDLDKLGDLITLDEIAALTGYAKGSLSPKMSRAKIKAVKRSGPNNIGLYDKNEIIDKIGYNPLKG